MTSDKHLLIGAGALYEADYDPDGFHEAVAALVEHIAHLSNPSPVNSILKMLAADVVDRYQGRGAA